MRMNSGSSLAFPCTICARITLTSISSTIHPSAEAGDGTGLYEAMLEAKAQGKIRHIGITNHRLAGQMRRSSQDFMRRFSSRSAISATEKDIELVEKCKQAGMGFIANESALGRIDQQFGQRTRLRHSMRMCCTNLGRAERAGTGRVISYIEHPPVMTEEIAAVIEHDRKELSGEFCRGCGYCMPCPAELRSTTVRECP